MPRISEFFGIIIAMYFNDHAPPHFHAVYAEHQAVIRVLSVVPQDGYRLRVSFSDGTERTIDVERYLRGPVFDTVKRSRSAFEAVHVDEALGTIVWPTGGDIDPEVLAGRAEPSWAAVGVTSGAT